MDTLKTSSSQLITTAIVVLALLVGSKAVDYVAAHLRWVPTPAPSPSPSPEPHPTPAPTPEPKPEPKPTPAPRPFPSTGVWPRTTEELATTFPGHPGGRRP
jgi:hypothetical protein